MRKLPVITKLQYAAEFLRELEAERGKPIAFSLNAREEDIPEHYTGLEVTSSTVIRWCEEGMGELLTCIRQVHSDQVTAFGALIAFVEAVAENDSYSGA